MFHFLILTIVIRAATRCLLLLEEHSIWFIYFVFSSFSHSNYVASHRVVSPSPRKETGDDLLLLEEEGELLILEEGGEGDLLHLKEGGEGDLLLLEEGREEYLLLILREGGEEDLLLVKEGGCGDLLLPEG